PALPQIQTLPADQPLLQALGHRNLHGLAERQKRGTPMAERDNSLRNHLCQRRFTIHQHAPGTFRSNVSADTLSITQNKTPSSAVSESRIT
ncbi:Hypothetical predicted protein, partial [Pelobates cultripes]